MEEELKQIIESVEQEISSVATHADFEQFKARISGPNGSFTALSKNIARLPVEERPIAGKLINIYSMQVDKFIRVNRIPLTKFKPVITINNNVPRAKAPNIIPAPIMLNLTGNFINDVIVSSKSSDFFISSSSLLIKSSCGLILTKLKTINAANKANPKTIPNKSTIFF